MRKFALALVAAAAWAQTTPAPLATATAALNAMELDPGACYRVRDLALDRGDLRFYFTDGWVIFAKPITLSGTPRVLGAVYLRGSNLDDAELSVLPPTTAERLSLVRFTGTPNLSEHLDTMMALFTDDTAIQMRQAIAASSKPDPDREQGLLLAARFTRQLNDGARNFTLRLLENLLNARPGNQGFFYAALTGRKLGNFDALYDPTAARHVLLGKADYRQSRVYYDIWTAFAARALRNQPALAPRYTISSHQIEATLQPDLNLRVQSTATVSLNTGVRALLFDISNRLTIDSATIDGAPAEVLQPAATGLLNAGETGQFLLLPPQPVSATAPHQVRFTYHGRVITEAGSGVYTVGARASWYPTNGIQFTRFDLAFTYPETLDLVFPGQISEQSLTNGQKRVHRVLDQPVRVAGFNVGRYESKEASRGGLTVTVYGNQGVETRLAPPPVPIVIQPPVAFPNRPGARRDVIILPPPAPPDPLARLSTLAADVAASFDYYTQIFGPPATRELMVSPIPGTFGQGFPGLLYLSTLAYLNPEERPEAARAGGNQLFFSETLQAHETAHQWWGNVVTTSTESDDWLMEALASYSSLMALEKRKGTKALNDAFTEYRNHLMTPVAGDKREDGDPEVTGEPPSRESVGPLRLGGRLDNSLAPGAWQSVIYEKGAWVIHMLRRRMGDAAFTAFLKDFVTRHRYQHVTTDQFFDEAAAHLPPTTAGGPSLDRHLDSFREVWVESTGVPKLTLKTQLRGNAPDVRLTLTVTQAGVNDRFTTLVPVEIQLPGAKPRTVWLETGPQPASETIRLPARPTKISLDPNSAVLRR
jgi:hypothetical protein